MTKDTSVVGGCSESTQPNYDSIEIDAKPATEYSWQERRAELLQLVRQAGHPRALNQTELAERYGVSQQQISKDFDRLNEHVEGGLGGRRALTLDSVLHHSIKKLQEEGEHRKAAKTAIEMAEWVSSHREEKEFEARLEAIERQQQDGEL